MMLIATIALVGMLGPIADDSPSDLVARLGSAQYAEREAAAVALKRLGRLALPALREARSGRDLEIRTRASALRDEIESTELLKPTLVKLDFHDRPLAEVIAEFAKRAGVSIEQRDRQGGRQPQPHPVWPDRRISLEAAEPVPFWDAVDRLCQAGGLKRDHPGDFHFFDETFNRLILDPGMARPPKSGTGPIRVEILRVRRDRNLDLTPGLTPNYGGGFNFGVSRESPGPGVNELRVADFFVDLLVSVEPRLRIVGLSQPERLTALDGQGRSVLREPTDEERQAQANMLRMNPHNDPQLHPELRFNGAGAVSSLSQHVFVKLADSTPPGTRLAELKGVVAVAVLARRENPLVMPLGNAKDKQGEADGIRLTLHDAFVKPSQFYGEIDLTLETEQPGDKLKVQGPGIAPMELNVSNNFAKFQMEILDEQDRAIPWSYYQTPSQGSQGRMRLCIQPREQGERCDFSKLRIRIFTLVGAATEVPFSFTDVPMP